jgi:hypothetical protein
MAHLKNDTTLSNNMKGLITLVFLSFLGLTIFAQSEITILYNEKTIGKNNLTNKDIIAKEFIFPDRIHDTYLDTITNCITVQLRGTSKNGKWLNNKGNVVLYDLIQKKVKWSKKIYYQQSGIKQHSHLIIQTIANKSFCLNYDNGENQWEVKNEIYYVEPFQKKGIGYKFSSFSGADNILEGIDLTNGNTIWQREINNEYGWNDIFHLNDSIIVIVATGLHSINVNNGLGWDYNTITGEKDYTATAVANAAGVALGVLTGTYVMTIGHNLVRDIVSNVLVDSINIYFASKEKIARLNYKGQVEWSTSIPKDLVSKSSIFIKDSLLYMINKGFAFMGYRQLDYGTPFIAEFDIKTGKQIFFNIINGKKDQINGFEINRDTLSLVFKNRVSKYSVLDGSLIIEKSFNPETYGELNYFIGSQVYVKTDSIYKSLSLSDTTKQYLFTKSGKIIVLNDKLEIVKQIDYDQLYIYYLWDNDYKFIAKDNKTTVLDKNNKSVANIDISRKTMKIGSKIYDVQDKSFVEIDLNDITKN